MPLPQRRRTRLTACVALTIASFAAATIGVADLQENPPARPIPWIDTHAPGVFGPDARPGLPASVATYRLDATVLFPLLVVSLPIASRAGIGVSSFTAHDHLDAAGDRIRGFEFFAISFPERSRGFSRLGFAREATRLTQEGAVWTAYFGVISANREETREEVDQVLDQTKELQLVSIIDGLITRAGSRNNVVNLELSGRWTEPADLYAEFGPRLAEQPPEYARDLSNAGGRAYSEPLAFLGGLQASLRSVARAIARGDLRSELRQAYVHNGKVLQLEVDDVETDIERGLAYVAAGWATEATAVRRIDYRILDEDEDEVEDFRLWVELPAEDRSDAFATPVLPLAFQFRPRAFLRIRGERVAR